ncbi:MAG TPA: PQQ-dependent sugar dehydrogenase [Steroidobacteraceae bacterium]|nr:PQQ-dependent sugar dehydrogenase [Steroidobacteraceae bacterium]
MNSLTCSRLLAITTLPVLLFVLTACHHDSNSGGQNGQWSTQPPSSGVTLSNAFPQLPAFTSPVLALQAPADRTQWYVVERAGHIKRFTNNAATTISTEVIDISNRVDSTSSGETGLLGMAFHPDFPSDPRVFLSYTTNINGQIVSRISAFTSNDNGQTLDANSEIVLLTVNQPESNHNGGNIVFGADGYLYIGFGDGGGGGDMHGAIGNGQNLNTLLGKMLRIDVGVSTATTYTIPSDNPYVNNPLCGTLGGNGSQACPEIYAYGFRNPWRFSFDRMNDNLWVGDVGQDSWEEVDLVDIGGNYGWRCYEGNHAYNTSGCTGTYISPIAEYDHSQGNGAIIGGYVYRGTVSTKTQGKYIFGDELSGRIWSMPTGASSATITELIHSAYPISSFAQDLDGELYAIDYSGGRLYKLIFN